MDIATYRREFGLSQTAFATCLTLAGSPATQGLVSQWESGTVKVPAERCAVIEVVSRGRITRSDLRPDVFGEPARVLHSMTKRALRAKLGLSNDAGLAVLLKLPRDRVEAWGEDAPLPALPTVLALVAPQPTEEPKAPSDLDAERIVPVEVA
ncbi:transcriptional regulator [Xanthomonas arboricola]|uniref:transcriptional regulator n=1 Tax=Xanthomonas arboricola TaxID=56448 RepID=UPI000F8D204B|nr:YdaS family helix-turn-helix protein [Xanthomonas arboricola]